MIYKRGKLISMRFLFAQLRIGEKLGLGFGLVGLLFLTVIGTYQQILSGVLDQYRQLQVVYQAKGDLARDIATQLLGAREAEQRFLLYRDPAALEQARRHLAALLRQTARLKEIDGEGSLAGRRVSELAEVYGQRLEAIGEAWRVRGLDHESGLQGAFRKTAHGLQELAASYQVGDLYINLLQIRRGEKDLALRHESPYRDLVFRHLDELTARVGASPMATSVRTALLEEIAVYRASFARFADQVLAQRDGREGKGPFRDAARRMETLIDGQYVPGMEVSVLELRRREKDYLLRLDPKYRDMVHQGLITLGDQIGKSALAEGEKTRLRAMLASYERDFTALVGQNERIGQLSAALQEAAERILAQVDATRSAATQAVAEVTAQVNATAARDARLMLGITGLTLVLGVLFTWLITRWISRPVRRMAGILDQLALEDPVERLVVVPGGRDEINAMAESVNRMADHKRHLLAWWSASLADLAAQEARAGAEPRQEAPPARERMRQTLCEELKGLARDILARSGHLRNCAGEEGREAAARIATAARTLDQRLEILQH